MRQWVTLARAEKLAPAERRVAERDDAQSAVVSLDGQHDATEDVRAHAGDGAPAPSPQPFFRKQAKAAPSVALQFSH